MDVPALPGLRQLIQKVSGGATLDRGRDPHRPRPDDGGRRHAGADGRLPDGAARARRDGGGDHRRRADAARRMNRVEVPPDAVDIVGTGGDGARHLQRLDLRGADRGRRRRQDRQARQPPRLLACRAPPTCSPRSASSSRCRPTHRALRRRGGRRLHVGADASSGHEALGADPRRARHPHHLQPAGAHLQSGRRQAPGGRRVLLALGGADRARAEQASAPSTSGWCTATTASTS